MQLPTSDRFAAAFLLSLLLHAGIATCLASFCGVSASKTSHGLAIDTRVPGVEAIVLCDEVPKECPSPLPISPQPALPTAVDSTPTRVPITPVSFAATTPSPEPRAASGGKPGGGPSAPGETKFFQVRSGARSVVFVIDCSASMGLHGRLALAKRELLACLEQLPASARFQVIAYNRTAEPLRLSQRLELVPATPDNIHQAVTLIAALRAEGRTEHLPALRRALSLNAEVIFFLTDADELRADQVRAITQLNHGRSVIHAIELSQSRQRPGGLSHLAENNRGDYRSISTRQ